MGGRLPRWEVLLLSTSRLDYCRVPRMSDALRLNQSNTEDAPGHDCPTSYKFVCPTLQGKHVQFVHVTSAHPFVYEELLGLKKTAPDCDGSHLEGCSSSCGVPSRDPACNSGFRGIRGVRAGHAKPVSVEFMFGGDGKSIPVRSEGLATSLHPQTLIFTSWACASDTVRLSVIARNDKGNSNGNGRGQGEVATGSVEVPIHTALSRAPRKTASKWHIILDDSGEEIAEVMMFLRWQPMGSHVVPPPSLLAKETDGVNERGAPGSWSPLSFAYDVAKSFYCQVASTPVASPVAKAAETLLANGYSLLAERVHTDDVNDGNRPGAADGPEKDITRQFDRCMKNALDKADAALLAAVQAGLVWLGWAAESIEYYKVGTASNIQKLVDLTSRPFRQPLDPLTTNSAHGSNTASDTSDEAEKAAGSPLRRGISSNGIQQK